jgi:Flp pilus assembly pilin Flp
MKDQNSNRGSVRSKAWITAARFLKDESGQGTAEYALILLIVLMMANQFKSKFQSALRTLLGKLETEMQAAGEE